MELDALLAPISDASPCGEDLSFSIEFDQIAEMRRQDDPTLEQGEWITSLKVADWPGVMAVCGTLLSQRTKDLRLAMWLTEAWAITRGYPGMAQGLQLCTALCERFWAPLHPQADGGDMEERIGNLSWLLQRLVSLADTLPVTKGRQGATYCLRDLAAARQSPPPSERPYDAPDKVGPDRLTLEQFNRAVKETPQALLLATLQAARQCHVHVLSLQQLIDGHLGADGPGFVQAKEALAEVVRELERLAREAGALGHAAQLDTDGAESPEGAATATDGDARATDGAQPGGPLRSRAQALQQLRDVASFFRRTEPHSPVAYLADKAVKWGEMPLHEWLRQVVKDEGAMSHLQELLGLDEDASGRDAAR
jgi:type VI secretion system protein ImpA